MKIKNNLLSNTSSHTHRIRRGASWRRGPWFNITDGHKAQKLHGHIEEASWLARFVNLYLDRKHCELGNWHSAGIVLLPADRDPINILWAWKPTPPPPAPPPGNHWDCAVVSGSWEQNTSLSRPVRAFPFSCPFPAFNVPALPGTGQVILGRPGGGGGWGGRGRDWHYPPWYLPTAAQKEKCPGIAFQMGTFVPFSFNFNFLFWCYRQWRWERVGRREKGSVPRECA